MRKFIIRLAELNIEINCEYDFSFEMCKDYISFDNNVDIVVNCSDEEIDNNSELVSREYGEFITIYKKIAMQLYKYDKVVVHGAAIEYNNKAYLFFAPSGIGKSTHIKLWKDNIKGVIIINGDKPIIDSDGYVYGTPWAGKENWQTNTKCKLNGIILVHRSNENKIYRTSKDRYIDQLLNQVYRGNNFFKNIEIFDKAVNNISVYNLYCNKEAEAAKVCFDVITK